MRLTERTYIDADGKATTDRTRATRLLGPEGAIIDDERAEALGLKTRAKSEDKMAKEPRNKRTSMTVKAK